MSTYKETIDYLYSQTPQFQQIGAAAYKPGLDTVIQLAKAFGNPQCRFKVIHVGGTNGKGSTSHTLAAVLQKVGYKVGLYTSPHLIDFRERMRVNGCMIPHEEVVSFVDRYRNMPNASMLSPSFFELTTVMAFDWFARERVDVAVIEVGLGGRLDSTNIVEPELSVITNVSFDHMAQLGNTLQSIAREKAGIMRSGVTVVCGEPTEEVRGYFAGYAHDCGAPIVFSQISDGIAGEICMDGDKLHIPNTPFGDLRYQLTGDCQRQNACTVIAALIELKRMGWNLTDDAVRQGFENVCALTGLMGRWMKVSDAPLAICDTGHNIGGWELLARQTDKLPRPLVMVLGFVNDKHLDPILPLLPRDARYIFTNADIPRALPANILAETAAEFGLQGDVEPSVGVAYEKAKSLVGEAGQGSVFIGGSTFVVADLLKHLKFS